METGLHEVTKRAAKVTGRKMLDTALIFKWKEFFWLLHSSSGITGHSFQAGALLNSRILFTERKHRKQREFFHKPKRLVSCSRKVIPVFPQFYELCCQVHEHSRKSEVFIQQICFKRKV